MAVFSVQTVLPVSGLTNLQSRSGSAGDIAIAAGYWAAGDGGGGQFYFEPASGSTTVTSVTQAHAHIDSTSFVASPITVTAAGHPFVTGQAVLLSGTGRADGTWIVTADGTWIVTRIDANNFTPNGSVGDSVTTTEGGDANSVTVTTALPHGRAVGQRLAIAGAEWRPRTASNINGQWDDLGVTGPTTLTIGASLTGSYRVGGVCGDNGFSVPTTSGSGRWVRIQQSPNNPGQRITQVFGSTAQVVSKLSRRGLSGTIEKFIDNDPDDPGGYYSRRNGVDATHDPYDGGEDWTSEGSLYLPFRRRFRQGFYLGSASQGLRPFGSPRTFALQDPATPPQPPKTSPHTSPSVAVCFGTRVPSY